MSDGEEARGNVWVKEGYKMERDTTKGEEGSEKKNQLYRYSAMEGGRRDGGKKRERRGQERREREKRRARES